MKNMKFHPVDRHPHLRGRVHVITKTLYQQRSLNGKVRNRDLVHLLKLLRDARLPAQRSKSRAPVSGERGSSRSKLSGRSRSSRALSRSRSTHPVLPPSLLPYPDSTSPTTSVERGRSLTKSFYPSRSRSPSPSVVPSAPIDLSVRFTSPIDIPDTPHHHEIYTLEQEASRERGRTYDRQPVFHAEKLLPRVLTDFADVVDDSMVWRT